jgi:hypothetical protein
VDEVKRRKQGKEGANLARGDPLACFKGEVHALKCDVSLST